MTAQIGALLRIMQPTIKLNLTRLVDAEGRPRGHSPPNGEIVAALKKHCFCDLSQAALPPNGVPASAPVDTLVPFQTGVDSWIFLKMNLALFLLKSG